MIINVVSDQIKSRRTELGLSLRELARRTGTSAATLLRYEKGWDRFELFTIRKLASALGCQVKIALEPLPAGRTSASSTAVLKRIRRLFWDYPLTRNELEKYPSWVVQRVLEYGTLDDVRGLISLLGRKTFMDVVDGSRFLSPKTESFWKAMMKQEGRPCTRKRSRSTAWLS